MSELVLAEAREQIDAVDRGLLAGINRRIELVRALHEHKRAHDWPLRDPGREELMVAALQEVNAGPLSQGGCTSSFTLSSSDRGGRSTVSRRLDGGSNMASA